MIVAAEKAISPSVHRTSGRLLLAASLLLGVVYFYVGHDVRVSTYDRYAPWSDEDDNLAAAGGNTTKGVALATLGLFGLYLLSRREGRHFLPQGLLPYAMAFFVAWAAASVLWSGDPGLSCRRLAVLAFCVLAACGFARQFSGRELVLMAVGVLAAYLAIGVMAEIAMGTFRPWATDYRFAGTVHPNTQGAYMAVLCLGLYCLARYSPERSTWLWSCLAIAFIFLLLTKSRTSCAAALLGIGLLWLLDATPRARLLAFVTAGLLASGGLFVGTMLGLDVEEKAATIVMLGRGEESEALTGRLPIWQELLRYVKQKPLLGYGFESFWTLDHIEAVSEEVQWPLREAHNAYIDSLLSIGAIGLAAMLACVGLAMRRFVAALRVAPDPGFAFALCMLVFGILNACMETGMGSANFLTLIAGACVLQLMFSDTPQTSPVSQESIDFRVPTWPRPTCR